MENKVKPTQKQAKAIQNVVDNGGNVSKAMLDAGYSPATAKTPQKLTNSKAWEVLMEKNLPDKVLAKVHKQLLKSTNIEHMVFPLNISDEEIKELLQSVNCVVKKFQHSETQTHVWFWASNDKSRKEALDMAYKLKGHYKDKPLIDKSIHITVTKEEKIGRTNRLKRIFADSI